MFIEYVGRTYAKDLDSALGALENPLGGLLTFSEDAELPADAVASGYRHGFREVWVAESDIEDYLYLVFDDDRVERWPRRKSPANKTVLASISHVSRVPSTPKRGSVVVDQHQHGAPVERAVDAAGADDRSEGFERYSNVSCGTEHIDHPGHVGEKGHGEILAIQGVHSRCVGRIGGEVVAVAPILARSLLLVPITSRSSVTP